MKSARFALTGLLVFFSYAPSLFAQANADAQQEARLWAEVRKPYFKNTRNDSLFVVNNSNEPFRYDYYTRGDDLGLFESMLFNANVGDVVGPLFLEEYAVLYKIAAYDSLYRLQASHLYIKPDGKSRKDTLNAVKKANQYLADVQKGANFEELVKKHSQDETAQTGGNLGWLWQGTMIQEFEKALANVKKGDILVIKSPLGAHLVKITEDKVLDRGRVKVVPLIKKI